MSIDVMTLLPSIDVKRFAHDLLKVLYSKQNCDPTFLQSLIKHTLECFRANKKDLLGICLASFQAAWKFVKFW